MCNTRKMVNFIKNHKNQKYLNTKLQNSYSCRKLKNLSQYLSALQIDKIKIKNEIDIKTEEKIHGL